MPQFEFLVMTEKNTFAYKLFLSLNISDFNLIFMWKLHPLPSPTEKSHPSFSATPFKSWGPVKPPFSKIWFEVQPPPPPQQKGGSAYYRGSPSFLPTRENRLMFFICCKSLWDFFWAFHFFRFSDLDAKTMTVRFRY